MGTGDSKCHVCLIAFQYANAMKWQPGPSCNRTTTINRSEIRKAWFEAES